MAPFRRARWGIRRTFQTEQAISARSVYDNVAMIHSTLRGSARRADVLAAIEFVGEALGEGAGEEAGSAVGEGEKAE
jgi:ABC-type branched-subunit amino acid transport system ATPase component